MERTLLSSRYRYFLTVAEHKSLSVASEKLFVTSSAISKSISTLEKNLDCLLFIRNSSGIRLTEKGMALYAALKKLQDSPEFTHLKREINSFRQIISIVTDSLMCRLLDNIIANVGFFKYKDIRLLYESEENALFKVTSGEADIAALYMPLSPFPPQLIYHALPDIPLVIYSLKSIIRNGGRGNRIIVTEDLYRHRVYQKVEGVVRNYVGENVESLILPTTQHVVRALMSGGICLTS